MPPINKTFIKDIVLFCNRKLDTGDRSHITYGDIEMIVNNPHPKKIKIKKKKEPPIVKQLIKRNYPMPCEFENEYKYFIKLCSILKLPFRKYITTLWHGPAIIVPSWKNRNNRIIKHIKIRIEKDILPDNHIAIHPFNYIRDDSITYSNIYTKEIESIESIESIEHIEHIELTEWTHENKLFYIDIKTNKVYEHINHLYIGYREYINSVWVIKNN